MSAPDLSKFLKPNPQGVRELEFRALGTECHIKIRLKSERDALQFAADTLEWIKNFEEKYSRYLDTSLISKITAAAGQSWVETDEDAERLLNVAEEVFRKSEGILEDLQSSGFKVREPGCSACLAMNDDKIPPGKYVISTSNRNFEGRQGPGARTILASPAVAAAAAITGKITDPRNL